MNTRPCYATINLDNLKTNFLNLKQYCKKDIIGVVKANAYGHGAVEVSKVLIDNGVTALSVATVEEALELRNHYQNIDIIILGPIQEYQVESCIINNISFPIYSVKDAQIVSNIASNCSCVAKIHFALDTGMGRIGYFMHNINDDVFSEVLAISKQPNISIEGIFTHFACADEANLDFMKRQYTLFKYAVEGLIEMGFDFKYIHSQNSAATLNLVEDLCNAARVGISMYGYYPSNDVFKSVPIKPCLSWVCRISNIKKVPKGTPIGYGSTHITNKDSIIATIPVGYADGFRRDLSNKFFVTVNGKKAPIVGNVCMDQTMIDVTDVCDCAVGDKVYLISDTYDANTMAEYCNTISYEILCGISQRVPRIYI